MNISFLSFSVFLLTQQIKSCLCTKYSNEICVYNYVDSNFGRVISSLWGIKNVFYMFGILIRSEKKSSVKIAWKWKIFKHTIMFCDFHRILLFKRKKIAKISFQFTTFMKSDRILFLQRSSYYLFKRNVISGLKLREKKCILYFILGIIFMLRSI